MVNISKYAVILVAIFLAGCVDSGGNDTGVTNASAASAVLTETEEGELANQTIEYISETFLKSQGLEAELDSIEPLAGEIYIVNFTFGRGMTQNQAQAYVTSEGKLILGQIHDITKPPETQAPAEPTRIDVSIDGDSCMGPEDAPVTIIEFSDYQCPYCQKFWSQTLPQIKAEYIDTGKVKFVYRDFPLSGHANAQKAAEATECADDQEKFWAMHDIIFAGQTVWSSGDAVSIFKGYASELELDEADFASCLDSGKYMEEVQKDLQDGVKAGVRATPAIFVNGILVSGGARPFSVFKQIIDSELAGGASASTVTGTCG
ncbi:MAG: thioredoxin domain-containing protein [Candidatus Hydrothermarchaeaceae archaeon]